jgi:hypothetical protein
VSEGGGMITALGSKVIGGLTPQYLGLLVLNIAFLGGLFFLLLRQTESRERALAPLLVACAHTVPMETFDRLLEYSQRLPHQTAPTP